jgi:hypothetical protein
MSSSSGPPITEYPGSTLSFGLTLVMWGAFLYFYPQSAGLPEWMQTIAIFLAFVCFILGAITAGAGISDFRQSQFMSHFSIALALAFIAYFFYFLSGRLADRPDVSMAARIVVIPAALAAMLMFGESISQLLTAQSAGGGAQPDISAEAPPTSQIVPRTDGVSRFERIASATIAFVSLAAALMALINEIRRGL